MRSLIIDYTLHSPRKKNHSLFCKRVSIYHKTKFKLFFIRNTSMKYFVYKSNTSSLTFTVLHMSRLMGKPTICISENKDADQLRAFVFANRIVQFLFYLNSKFQASSSFLCLYRPVCVGPVRKPHCWFSHEAAHIYRNI